MGSNNPSPLSPNKRLKTKFPIPTNSQEVPWVPAICQYKSQYFLCLVKKDHGKFQNNLLKNRSNELNEYKIFEAIVNCTTYNPL